MVLNNVKGGIFPLKPTECTSNPEMSAVIAKVSSRLVLQILTPNQMLQRLPIALRRLKEDNILEQLLNEIVYSLYVAKEITKKVYINIMNPIMV